MEQERVKLTVMGLSFNPIKSGAYALILAEENGPYRIPIIIGISEARSISAVLEHVIFPRPLTHDLFNTFSHAFGIILKEVFIYKFEDGIFSATMTFDDRRGTILEIDSRTSDAIAIAMRCNSPIYTTREIMEATGFVLENPHAGKGVATGENSEGDEIEIEWDEKGVPGMNDIIEGTKSMTSTPDFDNFSLEELKQMFDDAVNDEEYELAMELKKRIERLENGNNNEH